MSVGFSQSSHWYGAISDLNVGVLRQLMAGAADADDVDIQTSPPDRPWDNATVTITITRTERQEE